MVRRKGASCQLISKSQYDHIPWQHIAGPDDANLGSYPIRRFFILK